MIVGSRASRANVVRVTQAACAPSWRPPAVPLGGIQPSCYSGRGCPRSSGLLRNAFEYGWSGREDLNLRPHRPERCALPSCATPRPRVPVEQGSGMIAHDGAKWQPRLRNHPDPPDVGHSASPSRPDPEEITMRPIRTGARIRAVTAIGACSCSSRPAAAAEPARHRAPPPPRPPRRPPQPRRAVARPTPSPSPTAPSVPT